MKIPSEEEWANQLNQSALTYGLACRGLGCSVREFTQLVTSTPPMPKNRTYLALPKPGSPEVFVYAQWPSLSVTDFMGPNGPAVRELGRQWVVTINALWDGEYREKIAIEKGLQDKVALVVPVMGDINLIRNDIVHHRGIASQRNSGRCKLLVNWTSVGQEIAINELMVLEFMEHWQLVGPGPVLAS